ncbi:hypothetical protein BDR05DRAFT_1005107 [Suillus weaverae]|nr:hypothetical protein BDR05DRAFT_1005107 [Suillus weaverae]
MIKQLQSLCHEQGLSMQGRKAELVAWLAAAAPPRSPTPAADNPALVPPAAPTTSAPDKSCPAPPSISTGRLNDDINALAVHDASQLARTFQDVFDGGECGNADGQDDEEFVTQASGQCMVTINNAKVWVDKFIMNTHRKSGQQTEKSVLNIWKCWLTIAIASDQVLDVIINAHHIIKYLKYTGTRKLLTRSGHEQDCMNGSLSAVNFALLSLSTLVFLIYAFQSSLKKTMAMLSHVRQCQVDDEPSLKQA